MKKRNYLTVALVSLLVSTLALVNFTAIVDYVVSPQLTSEFSTGMAVGALAVAVIAVVLYGLVGGRSE